MPPPPSIGLGLGVAIGVAGVNVDAHAILDEASQQVLDEAGNIVDEEY